MANSVDHDQTAPFRSSLIWVHTAYAILSETLVYGILGHLPYFCIKEIETKKICLKPLHCSIIIHNSTNDPALWSLKNIEYAHSPVLD